MIGRYSQFVENHGCSPLVFHFYGIMDLARDALLSFLPEISQRDIVNGLSPRDSHPGLLEKAEERVERFFRDNLSNAA